MTNNGIAFELTTWNRTTYVNDKFFQHRVFYHSTFFFLDQFNRVKYHAQSSFFGASLSLDRISFTCLARAYLFPSLPRDELRNTSVYCHLFFFCTPTHAGGWGKGAEEENDLRSGEGGRNGWIFRLHAPVLWIREDGTQPIM